MSSYSSWVVDCGKVKLNLGIVLIDSLALVR